ncbi:MAG: hypothetical protein JXP34_12300 [Planctomycetes bacterium]|nr:hypothetical protein [Planctomycetota bacterium]
MRACLWVLILAVSAYGQANFKRGDINADGNYDLGDAISLLNHLFADGEAPVCADAADANDDSSVNIGDAVTVLYYLFASGELPDPGPACGPDPTADDLSCETFPACPQCPEECLTTEDLNEQALEALGEGLCVPSPWADISDVPLVGRVVVCPDGSLCTDGTPGCQIQIEEFSFTLDATKGEATLHAVGVIEDLPIDIGETGSTHCKADIDFVIDGLGEFEAEDIGCGYMQVTDITGFDVSLTSLEISASGGLICGLLPSFKDLFQDSFEEQIAALGQQFLDEYKQELIGSVLCPAP